MSLKGKSATVIIIDEMPAPEDPVGRSLKQVVRRLRLRNILRFILKCVLVFWILLFVCVLICLL